MQIFRSNQQYRVWPDDMHLPVYAVSARAVQLSVEHGIGVE